MQQSQTRSNLRRSLASPLANDLHRLWYHPIVTWGVPLLFAWELVGQMYIMNVQSLSGYIIMVNYLAVLGMTGSAFLLAFNSLHLNAVTQESRGTVILLILFVIGLAIGIFMAEYVPPRGLARRYLVTIALLISPILLLLTAPPQLRSLRRRLEWVIIFFASFNMLYVVFSFMSGPQPDVISEYTQGMDLAEVYGRQLGLFGHANISGMLLVAGITVLLFGSVTKGFPRFVRRIWLLSLSIGCLLIGSFLAILVTGLFLIAAVLDSKSRWPLPKSYVALVLLSLIAGWAWSLDVSLDDREPHVILNYRISAVLSAISERDFSYISRYSSLNGRWSSTLDGLREIPKHFLIGKGLGQNRVYTEYWQGESREFRHMAVHNGIISTWLVSGLFGVIPYVLLIWSICMLLGARFRRLQRKALGQMAIVSMLLIIFSITSSFDYVLHQLLVPLLLISHPTTEVHSRG